MGRHVQCAAQLHSTSCTSCNYTAPRAESHSGETAEVGEGTCPVIQTYTKNTHDYYYYYYYYYHYYHYYHYYYHYYHYYYYYLHR